MYSKYTNTSCYVSIDFPTFSTTKIAYYPNFEKKVLFCSMVSGESEGFREIKGWIPVTFFDEWGPRFPTCEMGIIGICLLCRMLEYHR